MSQDTLKTLYQVVQARKETFEEGSYTCYLFEQGLDKILKKCGEECSEMIIASKNEDETELVGEIGDLIYHMMVLMVEKNIALETVLELLDKRSQKIGNLKQFHQVDRES